MYNATSMTSVRPAVCLSVTQVDCDHKVQLCNKKWKSSHDRVGRCLGYLRAEADQNHTIIRIRLRKTEWKMWSFALTVGGNNLINGSSHALDQ